MAMMVFLLFVYVCGVLLYAITNSTSMEYNRETHCFEHNHKKTFAHAVLWPLAIPRWILAFMRGLGEFFAEVRGAMKEMVRGKPAE